MLVVAASAREDPASSWTGTVRSEEGTPITGVTLVLRSEAANFTASSNAGGQFGFPSLPSGSYRLTLQANDRRIQFRQVLDFPPSRVSELVMSADGSVSLNPAAKADASGGATLSGKAVSAIPLNKRDFGQLLLLAAGTMTDANGTTNFTQQFAVNGQRGVEA